MAAWIAALPAPVAVAEQTADSDRPMIMRGHRDRWLVVALVVAGCVVGIGWFVTRRTPLPSGSNRLVVYETNIGREASYVEGFESYLAVSADAGGGTTVTVPKPPGRYSQNG